MITNLCDDIPIIRLKHVNQNINGNLKAINIP